MCEKMERFLAEAKAEKQIENAVNLFKNKVSIEIIAKSLGFSIPELEEILKKNGCLA